MGGNDAGVQPTSKTIMQIDIHYLPPKRFIAVPQKHAIPESWAGAKFFKTIELETGDIRYGMGDAAQILTTIEQEGYAAI